MATHLEIEHKYDVDEEVVLPSLDGLEQVAAVETTTHFLEATYFDTADLTLVRAGITVRRRTGGHDDGWHLKLPTDTARQEITVPLDRATTTVPKQLRDLVWAYTRGADLATTTTLSTHRAEHRLLDGAGDGLAAVCEDVVTAETDGRTVTWREWEIESINGDPDLLASAGRLLLEAGASPSRSSSKLARALSERLPEPVEPTATTWRKKDPARLLVQARLREQVDELRHRDPLVRADVEEGVHKMRVAARRLRSNLATYRPVLDRDVTDPLRDELRWLGQVLGAVRDSEVQRDHLERALAELVDAGGTDLVRGPVRSRLRDHARTDHHEARSAALEALESPRYAALLDALTALAGAPPWTSYADAPIRDVLLPRVRRDWRRLEKQVAAGEAHLHEVRKAAKRARYSAEPLVAVYGRDAERLVATASRIQAILGDHQDTVTARHLLLEIADAAARDGESSFTFGVLHERQRELASGLESDFSRVWKHRPRAKLRRWLA